VFAPRPVEFGERTFAFGNRFVAFETWGVASAHHCIAFVHRPVVLALSAAVSVHRVVAVAAYTAASRHRAVAFGKPAAASRYRFVAFGTHDFVLAERVSERTHRAVVLVALCSASRSSLVPSDQVPRRPVSHLPAPPTPPTAAAVFPGRAEHQLGRWGDLDRFGAELVLGAPGVKTAFSLLAEIRRLEAE
jgi:hypothetical protein